jgi:V/A-type H+-transporting ATPase subunit K
MKTAIQILTAAALILSIVIPFTYFYLGKHNKARYKKSLLTNCLAFFGILAVAGIVTLSGASTASAAGDAVSSGAGMGFIGAALSVGLSGIGSGIGVASSASAALGAISEDGSIFGKSLIFVAMAEGIALYGLIISFMIIGQL